jgi:class 3 adenylate cyclase
MLLDVTENLKEAVLRGDEQVRAISLDILDRRIAGGMVSNRDGTVEFLFRILRGDHAPSRLSAAVMLWKMGDDYAAEVLRDFLHGQEEKDAVEILRRLKGTLRGELLPSLAGLIARDSAPLQEALRELLLSSDDAALREKVLDTVLRLRSAGPDGEEGVGEEAPAAELASERSSFKFERESLQELVMLFSDIQGYSKKAQVLTPQQLSTLLQEYEKLLLAHVDAHGGELVKRMGDGHMIVFRRPLDAVLAAIRIQKSMVRFNRYREETSRVVIRIGIHAGKVVRKASGDVLGNDVNIASRLESSARPGSMLVSERVYEKVKDYIHARELGPISVKNITEPIRVFEPFEIVLDLPVELDPLKTRTGSPGAGTTAAATAGATAAATGAAAAGPAAKPPAAAAACVSMTAESWRMLEKCFSALALAFSGDNPAAGPAVLKQVLARWNQIRKTVTSAPTHQVR